MQIFACPVCDGALYFDNLRCGCGAEVAFDLEGQRFLPLAAGCANREAIGCNWQAPPNGALCASCAMTEVVPDLSTDDNRTLWAGAEAAKRWVLANLGRWGWLTAADPGRRPVFEMLGEETSAGEANVTMGHDSGRVTINVTEADAATRTQRRVELGEPYRTMIGHYRHELGHFFWERLAEAPDFVPAFRALFGDERADYGEALKAHYARPITPPDAAHISHYASSHPHEDWAETFAHLLHLVDITDSFLAADLSSPTLVRGFDAYRDEDTDHLLSVAAELGLALNHVNRSMGLPDLYPFVLTGPVREKLGFVHDRIRGLPGRRPS